MEIDFHKKMNVFKKTDCRCSICGKTDNLICAYFIPTWTRILKQDINNMIPLCEECNIKRGLDFIELGKLKYLNKTELQILMRYYSKLDNYLYKYVVLYGAQRTRGLIDIDRSLLILNSYLLYCREHKDELDWESDK